MGGLRDPGLPEAVRVCVWWGGGMGMGMGSSNHGIVGGPPCDLGGPPPHPPLLHTSASFFPVKS